jgi:Fe(3+) dicitrate transport protein
MEGRDRYYNTYGADSRIEFANRSLFGFRQDIQAGVRYERQTFDNINREGALGEVLTFGNKGAIDSRTDLEADAFSAFVQTAIHLTPTLTVTPGLRFESVDISAQEIVDGDGSATSDHELFLPGISFAWEALPRTTVYGGYHRGYTPHVTRDVALENFPIEEEVGDNFEIGLRSTAVRGFTFDLAYFHSRIENYQIKEAFTDINGLNVYGTMDEVEIDGFEIGARLESKPFTGGPWNFFGEAIYTYARSIIDSGLDARDDGDPLENVSGNRLPEVPEHTANLTLGFAHVSGFDASATATYHGDFFVDTFNTVSSDEAGLGIVDDVWLLSARANYLIPNTGATLFVSGHNLTDEFYIADRSDGAKPGLGRTIMGGVKIKFD